MTETEQANDTLDPTRRELDAPVADRRRAIERLLIGTAAVFGVSFLVIGVGLLVYWAFNPHLAPAGAGFVYTDPAPGGPLVRTLWDWMGLLIVPLAVAAGAAFISFVQKRTELSIAKKARDEDRELARKARKSEQQIASDRLRQATLEAYYDRMTELLLEHGLRESADDSEVRSIARARTVAVIRSLDADRNRQLLAFLRTSKLIELDQPIIALAGADLSGADLGGVNLSAADLRGTNLRGANLTWVNLIRASLRGADLSEANLSGAYLRGANLNGAELSGADLSGADLIVTDLSMAHLGGAKLHEANLSGADLSGSKLVGATGWTIEQLEEAKDIRGAIMPDGIRLGAEETIYTSRRIIEGPTFAEWKAQYLARHAAENPSPAP